MDVLTITAVIVAFLAGCVVSRFIGGRDY